MSFGVLKPRERKEALYSNPFQPRAFPFTRFVVVALMVFVLFGGTFLKLIDRWSKDPSYSHGFVVPFLGLWLTVRVYRQFGPPIVEDSRVGSMAILTGAMLHLILTVIKNPLLDFAAFALVLWGIAASIGGIGWARHFLFPIVFLFFMFPLPATWTNFAGLWLQDLVAQSSSVLLDPFVVCYRRGNSLYLAGVREPLIVAAECSGLRQIVSFVALGVLVGGLSGKSATFRTLLTLAAIPAAIVANVLRILLMAGGAVWFGTRWMGGWMHDAPALVTLPLGLALFALLGWLLSLAGKWTQAASNSSNAPNDSNTSEASRGSQLPTQTTEASIPLKTPSKGLAAVFACLFAALIVQGGLVWYLRTAGTTPYPDLRAPFANLPLEISTPGEIVSGWMGRDISNLDAFRAKLPYQADDLLYRIYTPASGGRPLYLYLVYSRLGDDRKHHPEICIRDASGATEDFDARRQIHLDADGQRTVMRFRFRTGVGEYTTVYYWHYSLEAPPQRGQTLLRRLYQRQNYPVPSITAQVSLVADPREIEAVERGFLVAVDSALRAEQLPATARIGCNRLPIALIRDR
jgi:exosortase